MDRHSPDDTQVVGDDASRENAKRENAGRENSDRENIGVRPPGPDEPAWMWTDDDFTASPDFPQDFDANLAPGTPSRPALGRAIWRRAWLWGATALIGLGLGGAAFVVKPPPYKATTTVLLTQNAGSAATDQMLTEVALAQSHTVAEAALRSLGQPVSVKAIARFSGSVTATSLTDRVIQITVKAPSSSAAVRAAKATATAFLLIRNEQVRSAQQGTIASLTQEIGNDQHQVQALKAQLATLRAQPLTAARQNHIAALQAKLSALRASTNALKLAATTFESTTAVTTASMVRGSRVLDQATPVPRPHLRYPLLYYGGGLVGGLAVGLAFVIVQALVSRRLRRRDDISRALGAPVLLSVGQVRVGRVGADGSACRSLPRAAQRPAVRKIVAFLRRSLPEGQETSSLAVVAADDLRVPALTLIALASSQARDGKRVLIADLTPSLALGRLLGVTEAGVKLTEADSQEVLVAVPEPGDSLPEGPVKVRAPSPVPAGQSLDKAYRTADIMLTLTTLDPALGAEHLSTWAGDAVVILTAGMSSATKVHAIGEMIRAAGIAQTSAVLHGADKSDESLGYATSLADVANVKPAVNPVHAIGKVDGVNAYKAAGDNKSSDGFEPILDRDANGDSEMIGSKPPGARLR